MNTFVKFLFTILLGAALSAPASADYASAVLADNPIGYWRFNDANADDAAENLGTLGGDAEGIYLGGQLVSAETMTLADGRVVTGLGAGNTAFQVEAGADEYMQVIDPILNELPEFTMSAWVYADARDGNRIGLFGQNDAVEFGFINPTQIQLWTPAGQTLNYAVDPNVIPDETWFHLAAVANGSNIALYINGERQTAGPSYGNSDFTFNIGGGGVYDATGNQFTGSLDEVAIWDTALDEGQLQAHVAAAKQAGGDYAATVMSDSPIGYWGFNDPDGDLAGNSGSAGADLNGTYIDVDRDAAGPDETYPGFAADNKAIYVEAGFDNYVSVDASPLSGLQEFTLSGWVKPGFLVDNRVGLFGQNDAMEFGFIDPNTIQMWTPGGGSVNYTLAGDVNEDEWVHIAAVGTGEEIEIYIDGELVAVGGVSIFPTPVDSYGASDFPFNVGGGGIYDATGNQFSGILDEVAVWDVALNDAQIRAHFQAALGSILIGDFNGNGMLDAGDLDEMANGMMTNDPKYDLNGDGNSDIADRRIWVNDLKKSYMGDANLDGEFNSSDLVTVFTSGRFETGLEATWSEGDWTGDKLFNSSDFVEAFQGGGYELGPRNAVASVPEPSSLVLLLLGLLSLCPRRVR